MGCKSFLPAPYPTSLSTPSIYLSAALPGHYCWDKVNFIGPGDKFWGTSSKLCKVQTKKSVRGGDADLNLETISAGCRLEHPGVFDSQEFIIPNEAIQITNLQTADASNRHCTMNKCQNQLKLSTRGVQFTSHMTYQEILQSPIRRSKYEPKKGTQESWKFQQKHIVQNKRKRKDKREDKF